MRPLDLAILTLLAATPLAAQTAPHTPQILSALVAVAPTAQVLDDTGTLMPDGTGTALITQMLFELGINAPESPDLHTLTATCDPAPEAGDHACRVQLNIAWSGNESAQILRFALTPSGQGCAPLNLETFGLYDPCAWVIREHRITYLLAG